MKTKTKTKTKMKTKTKIADDGDEVGKKKGLERIRRVSSNICGQRLGAGSCGFLCACLRGIELRIAIRELLFF